MPAILHLKEIFFSLVLFLCFNITIKAQTVKEALDRKDTTWAAKLITPTTNLNELDNYGSTMLMSACRWGEFDNIKFLIGHGAPLDSFKSAKGRTELLIACAYYANTEVCKYLIEHGSNVNASSNDGTTALMLAAQFWKADIVELLLAKGANAQAKNKEGKTAMDYVKTNTVDEDLKKMLKNFRVNQQEVIDLLSKAK